MVLMPITPSNPDRQTLASRPMRTPTTVADAEYDWWREALARTGRMPMHLDKPQCGFFRYKLVRGGPWVSARIFWQSDLDEETGELIADETLVCEVNGELRNDLLDRVWVWAEPVSEAEFRYLEATRQWAAWHCPDDPVANPREPLNPLTTPLRF